MVLERFINNLIGRVKKERMLVSKNPKRMNEFPETPSSPNALLEKQPKYLSDLAVESAHFDSDDDPQCQFLEPNLAVLGLANQRALAKGAGFSVYEVDALSGKKVVKVERVVVRKDKKTGAWSTHYPWMKLGLGQDRPPMHTVNDAKLRRATHSEIKKRLEDAGLETAKGLDDAYLPKIYAEMWENPGGVLLESNEALVEQLYQSSEGRAALKKLADSIVKLSQKAYLSDFDTRIYNIFGAPITETGYPYPRNIMAVHTDDFTKIRFVAIDYNFGLDLTTQVWWKPEFAREDVVKRSRNGELYPNWELMQIIDDSIKGKYAQLTYDEKLKLIADDLVKYERMKREREIMESQAEHFRAQISVAARIYTKIEKMENAKILVPGSVSEAVPQLSVTNDDSD